MADDPRLFEPPEAPRSGMDRSDWRVVHEVSRTGEPVIVFRARDILSTMVIQHYLTLLESYVPYNQITDDAVATLKEFQEWQQNNPDSVRLPT